MIADTHPLLAHAAGPLLPYLEDAEVMEIRVTSNGRCFVVTFGVGKHQRADIPLPVLDTFLAVIASMTGAEWRASAPRLHAAFPSLGIRIQAARPPTTEGPMMVCRKHPRRVFPLDDFEAKGILTALGPTQATDTRLTAQPTIQQTLEAAVAGRHTIVIAGAVGSAKTSLLNALLATLRDSAERIVVLEDDPELRCEAAEVQTLRTCHDPVITMRDLGKDLLRYSPDRIVIGEVRDGAALDMLKAFQTGHPGMTSVHAESALGTLLRLEQLVQEVSVDPQRPLIGDAIDLIVHLTSYARSWRVTDLIAVDGFDGSVYTTRSLL